MKSENIKSRSQKKKCSNCNGVGTVALGGPGCCIENCPTCKGKGYELVKTKKTKNLLYIEDMKSGGLIGLHVSKSGHYIIDALGLTYYIPNGFIRVYWKADPQIVI